MKANADNSDIQRALSVSGERIGNVLATQGNFAEALKSYRNGMAIRERLAKIDPDNAGAQRDLLVSYANVGDALKNQGDLDEALKSYRYGLASTKRLTKADLGKWKQEREYAAGKIGSLSYEFLKMRDFSQALEIADQAILVAPNLIWLYTNRAHALMFLDRADAARAIYLQYSGRQKVLGEKSWETVVLKAFAELRNAGMTHQLMDQIEKDFSSKE